MKNPRRRKPGTNHSISMTDSQWRAIKKWAAEAGMSASQYIAHCMLTVNLSSKHTTAQPLVLAPDRHREIVRVAADLAPLADDEMSSRIGALARDAMQERLHSMIAQGRRAEAYEQLCNVFGDHRAEVIAAAMIPPEQEPAIKHSRILAVLDQIRRLLKQRTAPRRQARPPHSERRQ